MKGGTSGDKWRDLSALSAMRQPIVPLLHPNTCCWTSIPSRSTTKSGIRSWPAPKRRPVTPPRNDTCALGRFDPARHLHASLGLRGAQTRPMRFGLPSLVFEPQPGFFMVYVDRLNLEFDKGVNCCEGSLFLADHDINSALRAQTGIAYLRAGQLEASGCRFGDLCLRARTST